MTKDLQTRLSEDGKRIAALERQRDRLAEALLGLVSAEDRFAADTGLQTDDLVTDALLVARAALAELEKP